MKSGSSRLREYSEDQPRAENGQFGAGGSGESGGSGGGGGAGVQSKLSPPVPSDLPGSEKTITWQPNGPKDGTTLKAVVRPRGDGHEIKYGVNVQRTLENGRPASGRQAQEQLEVHVAASPGKGWVGQISTVSNSVAPLTLKGSGTLRDGLAETSSKLVSYAKTLPTFSTGGIGGKAIPSAITSPSGGEIMRFRENKESDAMKEAVMAETNLIDGIAYPKDAFAYAPGGPATWALRLWESIDAKVTRAQLGRAAASLLSGSEKADLSADALKAVKATLKEAYASLAVDGADIPPHILKESAHPEEIGRWYGEYRARLTEAGAAHTAAEIALIDELMDGHDAMKGKLQTLRRSPKDRPEVTAMKRAYAGKMQENSDPNSLEDKARRVCDAFHESPFADETVKAVNPESYYIEETYDDHVVVSRKGSFWRIPYTDTDGVITFGEPVEVKKDVTYEPVKESVTNGTEEAHLLESKSTDGSEWVVRLIRPGWSKNRSAALQLPRYYPEATLKEAAPRFEGVRAFAHNSGPHVADPSQRRAQDVVGWFSGPTYDKGVCATFTCIDAPLRTKLKEAWEKGKRDLLGFSIDAPGREEPRLVEGRRAAWVSEIQTPYSTDVVTDPAAGGELMRLVASADGPQKEDDGMDRLLEMIRKINPALVASPPDGGWTEATLETVLKEAMTAKPVQIVDVTRLKEVEEQIAGLKLESGRLVAKQHIRESLAVHPVAKYAKAKAAVEARMLESIDSGKTLTDEQIKALADEQVTILAEASDSGKVTGLGGIASVTQDEREKMVVHAMDGLFEGSNMNSIPRFTSLHEAYCRITGKNYFDLNNRTVFQESIGTNDYDSTGRRLTESIATTDWAQVFGDSITRKLVRDYNQSSQYDAWRSIVSEISSPKDFRTQRRVRVGGYGVLPAVSQAAPYQPLTSPADEEATYTPSKRGGTEDLTWESVLNDDIAAIRRVPISLARSAKITLYRFVMDLILSNPTIYDGDTLFHANHSNTFTNALSAANLLTTENAMLAQAAYGEATNNLGLTPRYFLTVRARRDDAWKLLTGDTAVIAAETGTTPNIFKGKYKTWGGGAAEPFHVANYETSTTKYVLIADPQEIPTIEVGFLGGQQEPELFVQDDERVGSRFSADKITYKVRHVYSGVVLDYRPFVQGNA